MRSVDVALDVRESGTAAQPVKSETFSDEWHVRVYSHAARSSSRSSLFEEDCLTTADSGQRSRRIGHLSRVFPPRDVLSSLLAAEGLSTARTLALLCRVLGAISLVIVDCPDRIRSVAMRTSGVAALIFLSSKAAA